MYCVHYARSALHMFAYVMCVWWVRVRCLKLDPLASMGWFVAAWALLAVAPGPSEPEARNGFPSGNVLPIPDSNVTLVASPSRWRETSSAGSFPLYSVPLYVQCTMHGWASRPIPLHFSRLVL